MKPQPLIIALFAVGTIGLAASEGGAPAPDSKADPPVFVGGIGAPTGMGRPDVIGKWKSWMLKESIDITTAQMWQVEVIYTNEWVDIQALGRPPLRSRAEVNKIHKRAFEQVRAILTPEQRVKFNLLPQHLGGGLTTRSPWDRADQLDKLVHLTPAQKEQALSVFIAAAEELGEAGAGAPSAQLATINRTMRRMIRSILTPEQQKIWDASRRSHGA
jgi:Spy/CpxP family protein refolding chaperone